MNEWKKTTTVALRLQEAMRLRGKKQIDLVNETGIAKGTISNYINGRYEPKAPAIAKLAQVLDCSDLWIMGFDVPLDRYAYVDPDDTEFLKSLPTLKPKQELPSELEAINVLLAPSGRCIMKVNGQFYLDECGVLTTEEVNELLATVMFSVKNAADMLVAKKTNEFISYFSKNDLKNE